jgi:hypothetical protein
MPTFRLLTALIVAFVAAAGPLAAQTSTLSGRIVDPLGGHIANAEIALLTTASQR